MCQGFDMQEFEVMEFMLPRARPPRAGASKQGRPKPSGGRIFQGPLRKMVPPSLATLPQKAIEQLPDYRHLGNLSRVYNLGVNQGLYYLDFTVNGQRRGYSGMSDDLARRLKHHRLCACVLGIDPDGIAVYVANDPDGGPWRGKERALHLRMRKIAKGVLTNQRLELELAS